MKVLLLTYPYCGGIELGRSIADDCGYDFIYDPFEIRPRVYIDHAGNEIVKDREYNYGDAVADNTLVVQNVAWHSRNPRELNHTSFLNGLRSKFNRVFCLMTDNIEMNWKLYCSSMAQTENENYWWKKWNSENCYEYDSSHFNQSHKNKIINSHQVLTDYRDTYNLKYIRKEDVFPMVEGDVVEGDVNLNLNVSGLNDMFADLDIGMPHLDEAGPQSAFYGAIRNQWDNKF